MYRRTESLKIFDGHKLGGIWVTLGKWVSERDEEGVERPTAKGERPRCEEKKKSFSG